MGLQKYQEWVAAGRRMVYIKLDSRQEHRSTVFCYDYDQLEGATIDVGDDPPTNEQMRANRKAELLADLARLEGEK
jgi:hypothetical protein